MSSPSNRVVKATQDVQIHNDLNRKVEEQEQKVKELEDEIQSLKDAKIHDKQKENRMNSANERRNELLSQEKIRRAKPSLIPTPPTSAERRNGYRIRRPSSVLKYVNLWDLCFYYFIFYQQVSNKAQEEM